MSILFVILATAKATGLPALDNSHSFGILMKIVEIGQSGLFASDSSAPGNNYLLAQKFIWIGRQILADFSRKIPFERYLRGFGEVLATENLVRSIGFRNSGK
jgi:hypothetical protein